MRRATLGRPSLSPPLVGALLCASLGCSVGSGEGFVRGTVSAPGCDLDGEAYSMKPSFFSAEPAAEQLVVRVQRGSDFEDKSDGLVVLVRDAEAVQEGRLGEALVVGRDRGGESPPDVQMTFYLNDTCPVGSAFRREMPVVYEAEAGTVTFDAIYAPGASDDVETSFAFDGIRFSDPDDPEGRFAVLSGAAEFLHARGRPAQRFP